MQATLLDGSSVNCEDEPFSRGQDGATHWTTDGKALIKLYHNAEPWRPASLAAIMDRFNAVRGDPYWSTLLCWPIGIVRSPRLGVLLPRAAAGMRKMDNFYLDKWLRRHPEDVGTWQGRLEMLTNLARGVRRFHHKGLCHSDLSGNNVFANPADGRAYILDCDGLVVPGLDIARPVVGGTDLWRAPELVAGRVRTQSVDTDKHSLAVLVYQSLLLRHPLEGRKIHDPDGDRNFELAMGERALFIEHPLDPSNRPQHLPYGPCTMLGASVSRLVHRAFVDGLHEPVKRPSAAEWERDLVRLADATISCPNPKCLFKAFPLSGVSQGRARVVCPWCNTAIRGFALPVLSWQVPVPGQVGAYQPDGNHKVAWPDSTLQTWHTMPHALPGPDIPAEPVATFHRFSKPGTGGQWCLMNQRLPFLEAADPGGPWHRVNASQAVELKQGRRLRFGPPGTARDAVVAMVDLV